MMEQVDESQEGAVIDVFCALLSVAFSSITVACITAQSESPQSHWILRERAPRLSMPRDLYYPRFKGSRSPHAAVERRSL